MRLLWEYKVANVIVAHSRLTLFEMWEKACENLLFFMTKVINGMTIILLFLAFIKVLLIN